MANKLLQITESETQNYQLLGRATGVSVEHCLYLANKYKENFFQKVVAYRFAKPDQKLADLEKLTGKKYLAIEFFEEKPYPPNSPEFEAETARINAQMLEDAKDPNSQYSKNFHQWWIDTYGPEKK